MSKRFTVLDKRRAGILLHPTSLPGAGDCGELGPEAHNFIDFLAASGISVWQMLPLGPTHTDGSPYQCLSVHAGNPLLISLDWLVNQGWLSSRGKNNRARLLQQAHSAFTTKADETDRKLYKQFLGKHQDWLDDYALFMALRQEYQQNPWLSWPEGVRDRHKKAISEARQQLAAQCDQIKFEQYVFFRQWQELQAHAQEKGILLFGDMPIFVAHDSAEVWAHREYFAIDEHGKAQVVAGVPPDYFSKTGQRWGNPHYRWEAMKKTQFKWWVRRTQTQVDLFDLIRIDHFRGFQAYWEIQADAETAMEGKWVLAPGKELLTSLNKSFKNLRLVAEDLGIITPEVEALRRKFKLPGMKILQFAFDGSEKNAYLPHNHESNSVVYTGTHDNDTTVGWYQTLDEATKRSVMEYLGQPKEEMPWPMIRAGLRSVAHLCMIPMQDLLSLGSEHRMNTPGTMDRNWTWRFDWDQVPSHLAQHLRYLMKLYDRQ